MSNPTIGDGEGAFACGGVGIVVLRADGTITRANPVFLDMVGVRGSEVAGLSIGRILNDDVDTSSLLTLLRRFGAERRIIPSRSVAFRRREADGSHSPRCAEISLVDVDPGQNDAETRLTLSLIDITDDTGAFSLDANVRSAETRYKDIYENVVEGIYRSSVDGIQLSANPALVRLNGYKTEAELLRAVQDIGREWYVEPGRREAFRAELREKGRVRDFVSQIYRHRTGEKIWISENARIVRDPRTGEPLCYEGTIREVTTTVELLREKEKLDKIAAQAPGCLFQSRLDAGHSMPRIVYASAGLEALCGVRDEEIVADVTTFLRRVAPDQRSQLAAGVLRSAMTLTPWRDEFQLRRRDGVDVWVGGTAVPEREDDGSIVWHGFLHDVTERREAHERIQALAFYDTLTGLPNREMLRDSAQQEFASSDRSGLWGAALFIDLDNFKLLNDTEGHHIGDQLLIEVARRLQGCLRANDTVARLGGDEFVVLLSSLSGEVEEATRRARIAAEKVRGTVSAPYHLETCTFYTSPSVGVEMFLGKTLDFDTLLKRADMAMYRAKANGRNAVCLFDPDMQEVSLADAIATGEVRQAIEGDELDLFVQPVVDMDGRIRGGEALLRWHHPRRGILTPLEVLRTADRIGLSGRLHALILEKAFAMAASWRDLPVLRDLDLSMNVAPLQIQAAGFVNEVIRVLKETGAPADRLILEVTEHAMLKDVSAVAATMTELKARGLRFSLDDFGTGYASLTYLRQLPLDEIKIDRSFVQDLMVETDANIIVGTTTIAARQLGLSVTGEGVEKAEQAEKLTTFGANRLQGFLYGAAMPEPEFRAMVTAQSAQAPREAGRAA